MEKAQFTRIDESTRQDWQVIAQYDDEHQCELPARVLEMLTRMGGDNQPYQVSRLEHCLQAASRAERDGADEEMIVAALVHDIGDELALYDHAEFAASILKPYVSRKTHWIIQQHDIFQGKYYWDHLDLNPDERERFRDHPWFDDCERFCRDWDCPSFDPDYPTLPLEHFEPMVKRVFGRTPFAATNDHL
ncbi:HD domain-containing protein [Rhodococcus sp. NPDC057529]|uniref:HD domain-containing protein n=1 Tax=Rhodococcus sp. NPDC057529 TaxID=3346158 RepID=UPI0036713F66